MAPELSVCVPVYKRHAEPNVATLAAALPAALGGRDGELVVALNGIGAEAAGVPAEARTVALEHNMGVAPGWNAAAQAAQGEILVFANDDVVPGPGALDRLAAVLREHPDAGVVGPVGATYDRASWRHADDVRPDEGVVACDAVSGFLFATTRAAWSAVGGFDEAYAPASWEEIDFNVAVQRLGLRSYAVGGVDAPHDWGISARQPPWRTVRWGGRRELLWSIHRRNRRHFLGKWAT
jgi:GT2 family glycosyltransferase